MEALIIIAIVVVLTYVGVKLGFRGVDQTKW